MSGWADTGKSTEQSGGVNKGTVGVRMSQGQIGKANGTVESEVWGNFRKVMGREGWEVSFKGQAEKFSLYLASITET